MTPSTETCRSSMASSSADCVLGLGPVDLVADDEVGEHGAGLELELARLLVEDRHAGDVARQQVRRELDAAHRAVDGAGQRLGQHRLPDARDVLDQQVPLGEQHDERELDDLGLALDDLLDVVPDAGRGVLQVVQSGRVRRAGGSGAACHESPPEGAASRARSLAPTALPGTCAEPSCPPGPGTPAGALPVRRPGALPGSGRSGGRARPPPRSTGADLHVPVRGWCFRRPGSLTREESGVAWGIRERAGALDRTQSRRRRGPCSSGPTPRGSTRRAG